jgi:hypothetical protein
VAPSICQLQRVQRENQHPTLGVFRPAEITRLSIEPTDTNWNTNQLAALSQQLLPFQSAPTKQLEKIPFDFKYSFRCDRDECSGHTMICTDWELGQSYRQWKMRYGPNWEDKFRQRYELDMKNKFDTHFVVGTLHQYPNNWIIVGLFYPPKPAPMALFE